MGRKGEIEPAAGGELRPGSQLLSAASSMQDDKHLEQSCLVVPSWQKS